jgi:hypothetical protein
VLVVEINVIDPEPAQAGLASLSHILRFAVHAAKVGIGRIANYAELGGQYNFVALAPDSAPHQFLVFIWTVDIGSIKKRDAKFQGAMNRRR